MKIYKKVMDFFINIVSEILIFLIGGIVVIMLIELVLRNFFNTSFQASTELCGFLFMWMAFLGIVVLYDQNKMICLDMFSSRMMGVGLSIIFWINKVFSLGLGVVMVFSYIKMYPIICTSRFSSMQFLTKTWHFLPMAIAGIFIVLKTVYQMLEWNSNIKYKKTNQGEEI